MRSIEFLRPGGAVAAVADGEAETGSSLRPAVATTSPTYSFRSSVRLPLGETRSRIDMLCVVVAFDGRADGACVAVEHARVLGRARLRARVPLADVDDRQRLAGRAGAAARSARSAAAGRLEPVRHLDHRQLSTPGGAHRQRQRQREARLGAHALRQRDAARRRARTCAARRAPCRGATGSAPGRGART